MANSPHLDQHRDISREKDPLEASILFSEEMHFSRLNHDVVFEIFLHFTTIDQYGPFTLILVCTKWRDIVVSKPRLWTWVIVDLTQPDWKDRANVAVALSRDLPMNLVIGIPSGDIDELMDAFPRCQTVFLDISEWSRLLAGGSALLTHEECIENRDEYKQVHDALITVLACLERRGIHPVMENADDACFSFSTWTILERVSEERSLDGHTTDIPLHLITTLVFDDQLRRSPQHVQLINVWPYLPLLPHLKSLDIFDNFIDGEPSSLPEICLPSLLNLTIDCAVGLNLFLLLHKLKAPLLQTTTLNGVAPLLFNSLKISNEDIHPTDITVSFNSIGNTDQYEFMDMSPVPVGRPIWNFIRQLTLDFFHPRRAQASYMRNVLYYRFLRTLQAFLLLLPSSCAVRLRGGEEIADTMRLNIPSIENLDITYRKSNYSLAEVVSVDGRAVHRIRSLTLSEDHQTFSPTYLPWFESADHIIIEASNIDWLLRYVDDHHPAMMRVFNTGASTCHQYPRLSRSSLARRIGFANLTQLRCTAAVAIEIIAHFGAPRLRDLSLSEDEFGILGSFGILMDVLMEHSDLLSGLSTIAVEGYPPWLPLLHFVGEFNKLGGGGIAVVKLPGLPHPLLLQSLIDGLKRTHREEYIVGVHARQSIVPTGRVIRCRGCRWGAWSCFIGDMCARFSTSNLITITKETMTGVYNHENTPNDGAFR